MAIVFISPKEREKKMVALLIGIIALLSIIFIWQIFLKKPSPEIDYKKIYKITELQISFQFLDSKQLESLKIPSRMESPSEKERGKENPFLKVIKKEEK